MKPTFWIFAAVVALWMHQPAAAQAPPPRLFPTTHIQDVYRVLLDRDALLLESIAGVIKANEIHDGEVLVIPAWRWQSRMTPNCRRDHDAQKARTL